MNVKLRLYVIVILLMSLGIGVIVYKHYILGFPLLPDQKKAVWSVEARIDFTARGDPVIVSFALPPQTPDIIFTQEEFASPDYGFSELPSTSGRRAQWSKRSANGHQTAYYRLSMHEVDHIVSSITNDLPTEPKKPEFNELHKTAATTLLDQVRNKSANTETFTRELIATLNSDAPNQNQGLLLKEQASEDYKTQLIIDLLALEGISARIVRGLYLQSNRRKQSLSNFVEVYIGNEWLLFNQTTGKIGKPKNLLIWQRGDESLLDVIGGKDSQISFSIIKNVQSTRNLAIKDNLNQQATLMDFSIYSLPIEQQKRLQNDPVATHWSFDCGHYALDHWDPHFGNLHANFDSAGFDTNHAD